MGSLIKQRFAAEQPTSPAAIRQLAAAAAAERLLPCLMTSMTTLLALLPVLSATGRGADLMRPMAIPTLGGITFVALNLLLVPVLFCWMEERQLAKTA
jgi:Cu(I)/Ag(I) efflux system membrane protein CusA/SilA